MWKYHIFTCEDIVSFLSICYHSLYHWLLYNKLNYLAISLMALLDCITRIFLFSWYFFFSYYLLHVISAWKHFLLSKSDRMNPDIAAFKWRRNFESLPHVLNSLPWIQGRNEVYGIRDQRPKTGWDPGSQWRDLGSQPPGSGSAVFFIGSRIRRSG